MPTLMCINVWRAAGTPQQVNNLSVQIKDWFKCPLNRYAHIISFCAALTLSRT